MIAIHRTYEGNPGETETVLWVWDGAEVQRLDSEASIGRWAKSLSPGTPVVSTSCFADDPLLASLSAQGVRVMLAHWHATGIPKGLSAEEIVRRFGSLPEGLLRPFRCRPDIVELRTMVCARRAVLRYAVQARLRLDSMDRANHRIRPKPEFLAEVEELLKGEIHATLRTTKGEGKDKGLEPKISAKAKLIPECVLWNQAAGVTTSWTSASEVVSYVGDPSRFPAVASLWHYAGLHVVGGAAPRSKEGQPEDWNRKLKIAVLQAVEGGVVKGRNPKWRPFYDRVLAEEIEAHSRKCRECGDKKTSSGRPMAEVHSAARARRRTAKEILKEFWVMCNGKEYRASAAGA